MKRRSKWRRRQLDQLFGSARAEALETPQGGWVRAVREALGMSAAALARRIGIAPPTLHRMEHDETRGAVSLQTLERAARAMDCRLVYWIVPNSGTFEDAVRRRAMQLAEEQVRAVDRSMRLESQGVDAQQLRQHVRDVADELVATLPRNFWDDAP